MKKNKRYFYVGVISNNIDDNELKFVYKIDIKNHVAYYETQKNIRELEEKPIKFSRIIAHLIADELCKNRHYAFVIDTTINFL